MLKLVKELPEVEIEIVEAPEWFKEGIKILEEQETKETNESN